MAAARDQGINRPQALPKTLPVHPLRLKRRDRPLSPCWVAASNECFVSCRGAPSGVLRTPDLIELRAIAARSVGSPPRGDWGPSDGRYWRWLAAERGGSCPGSGGTQDQSPAPNGRQDRAGLA
jgi:hypothetical protein